MRIEDASTGRVVMVAAGGQKKTYMGSDDNQELPSCEEGIGEQLSKEQDIDDPVVEEAKVVVVLRLHDLDGEEKEAGCQQSGHVQPSHPDLERKDGILVSLQAAKGSQGESVDCDEEQGEEDEKCSEPEEEAQIGSVDSDDRGECGEEAWIGRDCAGVRPAASSAGQIAS